MTMATTRRKLAGALTALAVAAGILVCPATPAQAAETCERFNIRLYRAAAQYGQVDTTVGNWIGADYDTTGVVVVVGHTGYYTWVAAFGNHLIPYEHAYYTFVNAADPFIQYSFTPQISGNSVLNDTNRFHASNMTPGFYYVNVGWGNPCYATHPEQPASYNRYLGILAVYP